jgi:phosphoserine phosphatase RsbU/P
VKILIAEDDPVSRRILTKILSKWGHEVVVTENGLQAWQCLGNQAAPQLAILDWMMPDIDGLEVCRRLRQSPRDVYPYIILLTANRGVPQLVKGMEAGADDYLTKPYDPEELRVRIQVGIRVIELQARLSERVRELETALEQVKQLQGILPICSYCRKIRDDGDYWQNVESYIATHSAAQFSHSICPACYETVVKPHISWTRR